MARAGPPPAMSGQPCRPVPRAAPGLARHLLTARTNHGRHVAASARHPARHRGTSGMREPTRPRHPDLPGTVLRDGPARRPARRTAAARAAGPGRG